MLHAAESISWKEVRPRESFGDGEGTLEDIKENKQEGERPLELGPVRCTESRERDNVCA